MKRIGLTLFLLVFAFSLKATQNLTYFVYVESQFLQGYWKDADEVYNSGNKFLYPHSYTDLFGTVKKDFYNKLLERLNEHHDFYTAVSLDSNTLKKVGYKEFYDTLNFAVQPELTADQIKTVKNELTTTVLSAGECQAIRLKFYQNGQPEKSRLYDYSDLDYPVFDLVNMKRGRQRVTRVVEKHVRDTIYKTRTDTVKQEKEKDTLEGVQKEPGEMQRRSCWDRYLWLAVIAVLGILLVRERRRSKK